MPSPYLLSASTGSVSKKNGMLGREKGDTEVVAEDCAGLGTEWSLLLRKFPDVTN
jgi:hypothetical protein